MDAETRATKLLEIPQRSSTFIRGPCVRKSQQSVEVRGISPKTALSMRGTSPLKPARSVRGTSPPETTPGIGKEEVFSPETLMRYIPPSSRGLRLADPLRSCSVAGSDKRDRKSALPFALRLRYSSV